MVTPDGPRYVRRERGEPLSFSTKLYQGIGAIPDTVKNWVFSTFILLYYRQILGVDAVQVSIALAIAIVFDAITDPLVASYSDNLSTRWGRRHPLMLIASLPLGAAIYGVFTPPPGLSHDALFFWLLSFTVLTRGLMTLFFVPWAAIAAELSDDYDERTSVMSFRFAVGWTIGVCFPFFVFTVLMPATEAYPAGQLNPAGYPAMALCAGVLLSGGALLTTLLTRREIPYLRRHAPASSDRNADQEARRPAGGRGLSRVLAELWQALQNRQFKLVFFVVLLSAAIGGTTANINVFMTTFFWGLTTEDLRWFSLAALGAIAAFPFVAAVQRRWDKKHILLACAVVSLVDGIALVNLRFLGVLPENGDPRLLAILVGVGAFGAAVAVIQGILGASVVADILDDHELRTGLRQEAMFNAALSFSGKAISGLGIVLGGFIIEIVGLPAQANPSEVPADTIFRLGLIVGVGLPLLYLIPIALWTRYRITRAAHAEIRAALQERAAKAAPPVGDL